MQLRRRHPCIAQAIVPATPRPGNAGGEFVVRAMRMLNDERTRALKAT
jgi:hypothetical protein